MTNTTFETIATVIKNRRSAKLGELNGNTIDNDKVNQLLELARWAPTHRRTEPWHFFVYTGKTLEEFGKAHGDLYWNTTPEDKRLEATREKLIHNGDKASHLLVAVMKRGTNEKIPQIEEINSASAAVQNILLGATAMGVASFWSTGGRTHHPSMKEYLGLAADDMVLGLVYLGYTDEPAKEGMRNAPITDKVTWVK